ncbi:MAG: hypothetical protein IPM92_04525 [Saprospiraceae bacterium]|nr:hypothetical protein [Saprospiraceae bacterium]
MYFFLWKANGAPTFFKPWLNIPSEDYYFVNIFLLAPSMLICWLLASSMVQVFSKALGGDGSFEQTLILIALSINISMWGSLIHDLPMSFLSMVGVIDARQHEIDMNTPTVFRTILWACYLLYLLSFLILFPLSVKVVHRLKTLHCIWIGWTSFIVFQLIFLIFNR